MSGLILQFGTSRFLQAHFALFAHEAREAGQDVPPIGVVQVTGSAERSGRVAAFGHAEGYPVIIRGLEEGVPIDRTIAVKSVAFGISTNQSWTELTRLFAEEARYIVSNTGDSGYDIAGEAQLDVLLKEGGIPRSFPGKLIVLMHARWQQGARPITMLPCELVPHNAAVLRDILLRLITPDSSFEPFRSWLTDKVIWADTLVDRIVSAPIEPVGAIAEPYALWAIESRDGLVTPFQHPSLTITPDLLPFERLKLHILNLTHTCLADIWLKQARPQDETVLQILSDEAIAQWIAAMHAEELIPGFAHMGMADEAEAYVKTTMQRLLNPYLEHRIADIAQNHAVKVERRISAFLAWVSSSGQSWSAPRLEKIAGV